MSQFPVSSSILSTDALSVFLQAQYGLRGPVACSLIKAGVNHTYNVWDGSRQFVFRAYCFNWRSKVEVAEELRLLNLLKSKGLRVAQPISDAKGNFIQDIDAPEGKRHGVLFVFAEGQKPLEISLELSAQFGIVIARMHMFTHNLRLARTTYSPKIILQDSLEQIRKFLPAESEELEFLEIAQQSLLESWAQVQVKELRQGAVHLDIWHDNVHQAGNGELCLFDFDFCGNGWLCLDLAYHILQIHATERDPEMVSAKVEAFLSGYCEVTMLSPEEMRILPMLGVSLYFFYLGVQCQRHHDWSNVFLNGHYLKRYIDAFVRPAWQRWVDCN